MSFAADKKSDERMAARPRFAPQAQAAAGVQISEIGAPGGKSQRTSASRDDVERLVPSASHLMAQAAIADAERMMERMRQRAALSADVQALIAELKKPAAASDDLVALALAGAVIRQAASNDLREVAVYRTPAVDGRIWEALSPVAQRIHQLCKRYLAPLGYALYVREIENAAGAQREFELILRWR